MIDKNVTSTTVKLAQLLDKHRGYTASLKNTNMTIHSLFKLSNGY